MYDMMQKRVIPRNLNAKKHIGCAMVHSLQNLTSVIVPPDRYAAQYCEDTWDLRELYKLSGSK